MKSCIQKHFEIISQVTEKFISIVPIYKWGNRSTTESGLENRSMVSLPDGLSTLWCWPSSSKEHLGKGRPAWPQWSGKTGAKFKHSILCILGTGRTRKNKTIQKPCFHGMYSQVGRDLTTNFPFNNCSPLAKCLGWAFLSKEGQTNGRVDGFPLEDCWTDWEEGDMGLKMICLPLLSPWKHKATQNPTH